MKLNIKKDFYLFAFIFSVIFSVSYAFASYQSKNNHNVSFNLTDQHNKAISNNDLKGKPLLVFFGFSSCFDICSTQMSRLTQVLNILDNDKYENKITPVFISIDPKRDSPDELAKFLEHYHKSFIGLTGTTSAIHQATNSFKTYFDTDTPTNTEHYQLTHSSLVYLVDKQSKIVGSLPFNLDINEMAAQTKSILF